MNTKYVSACGKLFEALKLVQSVKEPKLGESTGKAQELIIAAAKCLTDAVEIAPKKG